MLNKIFLAILALAGVAMAFFTFYSWSWLESIGSPVAVVENYNFHSETSWIFLWVSAAVILVLGNAILWTHRTAWAMWVAGGYFVVFVIVKYFWLDQTFLAFKKANGLFQDSWSFGPFFGAVLCIIAGGIVFFDQFIVVRLAEKMHPQGPKRRENLTLESSTNGKDEVSE